MLPDYEGMLEGFYRKLPHSGNTCVDIGAHVGRHTFPMAECIGIDGHIIAIEPIPMLAKALREDVRHKGLDRVIVVHELALSETSGTSTLIIAEDAPGYSGLRRRTYDVPTRTVEIEVTLSTLDSIIDGKLNALHYIKVDAEGAEWSILQGACHTVERFRPVVSFEFGEASYGVYGVIPEDVYDFFRERGYQILDIRGRGLSRDGFTESSRRQELWDYVAVHAESDCASSLAMLR